MPHMKKGAPLMLTVMFALCAGAPIQYERSDAYPPSGSARVVPAAPASGIECTTTCWDGSNSACGGEDQHVAWEDDDNSHSGVPHSSASECLPKDCAGGGHQVGCGYHLAGALGAAPAVGFIAARDAVALLEMWPHDVVYNPERRGLQIFGCEGALVAHLPVDEPTHIAMLQSLASRTND